MQWEAPILQVFAVSQTSQRSQQRRPVTDNVEYRFLVVVETETTMSTPREIGVNVSLLLLNFL
jgi:hypothetical protein